jgi:hypothetical protein
MSLTLRVGLLVGLFGLSAGAAPALAGGKDDYEYQVRFEPKQPTLGENYVMHIQVWNNDTRYSLRVRAGILKLPDGDKLLSTRTLERRIEPGGTHTFRFDVYCGTEKGSISYDLAAGWE